jgi:serine/threonine-protein kinase
MIDCALPPGSLLAARYRIGSLIARGGMGAVHAARDERLDRDVAVKTLRLELVEDAALVRRFEREAQTAARLGHPGIAQVLDFGRTPSGILYLVMERVQGETLSSLLKREGKLAPMRAADLVEQALGVIASAHAAGVVHRDLKPANLMVTPTGESREVVKVLDFGIAHLMDSVAYTRLTQTGVILGTPTYMAPEQSQGQPVDARTDVYAMGVILWVLLTGQKPYGNADLAALVEAVLFTVPTRADLVVPEVPSELASIADMAMQKDPSRRFADANAMGRALVAMRHAAGRLSIPSEQRMSLPPEPQRMSLPSEPQRMSLPTPAPSHLTASAPVSPPITNAGALRWLGMLGAGLFAGMSIVTALAVGAIVGTWAWWNSSVNAEAPVGAQLMGRLALCSQTQRCCEAAGMSQDVCSEWGSPTQLGDCAFALQSYRGVVASRRGDLSACGEPAAPSAPAPVPVRHQACEAAASCCRAYMAHFHGDGSGCPALGWTNDAACQQVLESLRQGSRTSGARIPECD